MQVLVISDTHLQNELFQKINQTYPKMDYYLHCGDSSLKKDDFLLNKYYTVKGNHDDEDFPVNIILEIGKYRCLITHGNAYDIYYGNDVFTDILMFLHIPKLVTVILLIQAV